MMRLRERLQLRLGARSPATFDYTTARNLGVLILGKVMEFVDIENRGQRELQALPRKRLHLGPQAALSYFLPWHADLIPCWREDLGCSSGFLGELDTLAVPCEESKVAGIVCAD